MIFMQASNFLGSNFSGPKFLGDQISRGPNFLGTKCGRGPFQLQPKQLLGCPQGSMDLEKLGLTLPLVGTDVSSKEMKFKTKLSFEKDFNQNLMVEFFWSFFFTVTCFAVEFSSEKNLSTYGQPFFIT